MSRHDQRINSEVIQLLSLRTSIYPTIYLPTICSRSVSWQCAIIDKMFCLDCSKLAKNQNKKLSHLRGGQSARQSIYSHPSHLYVHYLVHRRSCRRSARQSCRFAAALRKMFIFKQGVRSFSRTIPDQTRTRIHPAAAEDQPLHWNCIRSPFHIYENIHLPNDP